ncbi:MAG: hypothetical protein Q9214_006330, partial [Letrouitia sp. 1 TL-2023]
METTNAPPGSAAKRSRTELEHGDAKMEPALNSSRDISGESSSDDGIGPALPSSAPKKKKRKLPYEQLYLAALPQSPRYSKSLMHKDQLSFVTMTPFTDFLITSSIDGVVKFWKKVAIGIESVKEFKAHIGDIKSVSVSQDGRSFATAGVDKTIKIFDVITFGQSLKLLHRESTNTLCEIFSQSYSYKLRHGLCVGCIKEVHLYLYLQYLKRGESQQEVETLSQIHRSTVVAMAYNNNYDCVVSADESGMIEYWSPAGNHEKPDTVFEYKSSTNLFDFKKTKSVPTSITISPSGARFATFSFPDRKVRLFDFASGKLYRTYDESIATISDMQQAGTALQKLEDIDFGRRLAIEREIENPALQSKINVIFDESSNFVVYGSILGTKVINTFTNQVVKVFGKDEPFRSLNLAIYQGQPQKKGVITVSMAASSNPLLQEAEERDPMLVATGSGKVRFYMFTNETEISKSTRDIQNEKPRNINAGREADVKVAETGHGAILHTTYGDIHIRLFPEAAPKAVENFVTHSKNGYYNNTIFHRVIRKFMIQCGDPLGD